MNFKVNDKVIYIYSMGNGYDSYLKLYNIYTIYSEYDGVELKEDKFKNKFSSKRFTKINNSKEYEFIKLLYDK